MTNDYIGRENALECVTYDVEYTTEQIKGLPSADVVPVVHAYWIDTDNYYRRWRCSACSGHTKEAHPPVCPFCGAKMDGKREE